jgi:hypothetical protein
MRWQQQNNSSLELFCVLGCVSAREGDRQLRQDGQIELLLVKWHPAKLREKTDDGHIIMRSVCPPHPFPSFSRPKKSQQVKEDGGSSSGGHSFLCFYRQDKRQTGTQDKTKEIRLSVCLSSLQRNCRLLFSLLSDGENVPTMNDTLTWFLFFFLSDARLIYAQTRWAHQQQQGEKDATVLLMKPLL